MWTMARLERLVVPGIAVHVRQRGVNRQNCFVDDTDRLVFLSQLRNLVRSTACALHAYCLMTNHVHLLLTPSDEEGCSTLMRDLGRRYVPYFNRRHGRTGTLWDGRFRSCLVDSARYVLACYRYIEDNPVEARMVSTASAYPWSSYAGNAGMLENNFLTPHPEYMGLAEGQAGRLSLTLQLRSGRRNSRRTSPGDRGRSCAHRRRAQVPARGARTSDRAFQAGAEEGGTPAVGTGLRRALRTITTLTPN